LAVIAVCIVDNGGSLDSSVFSEWLLWSCFSVNVDTSVFMVTYDFEFMLIFLKHCRFWVLGH